MIYEYKVIKFNSINLEKLLNEFGQQGWDLCGIHENTFIFKKYSIQMYNLPYIESSSSFEFPDKVTSTSTSIDIDIDKIINNL